jgi:hypothetical protein
MLMAWTWTSVHQRSKMSSWVLGLLEYLIHSNLPSHFHGVQPENKRANLKWIFSQKVILLNLITTID